MPAPIDLHEVAERELSERYRFPWRVKACMSTACLSAGAAPAFHAMEESIEDGWTPPPFVATWQDDHLVLEDGNHRAEGVRRSGDGSYWCVVGVNSDDERAAAQAAIDAKDGLTAFLEACAAYKILACP